MPSPTLIRVDNRIRFSAAVLPPEMLVEIKRAHEHTNPEFGAKQAIGVPTWNIPREIRTWDFKNGMYSVPRGGLRHVRKAFDDRNLTYTLTDNRTEGEPCAHFPEYVGPPLRYYQEDMITAAMGKENALVRAPTGSGKSLAMIAMASRIGLHTLIVLPTAALLDQWMVVALGDETRPSALEMSPDELGLIRGPKKKLRPLTVTIAKSLAMRVDEEICGYFGVVICDEAQLFAANTFQAGVDPIPAKYRIAVSADERRKDKKEFLIHDLFGHPVHETSRRTLEEQGHILNVEIRVWPTEFRADWYGLAENEDDARKLDFPRLLQEMSKDAGRNELLRRIVVEEEKDEQIIVLTHLRDHCMEIDRMLVASRVKSGFLIGGDDYSAEFETTSLGLQAGRLRAGVGTYKALGFGVDLPAVGVGVAATPIAGNPQNFNQVRGRLCRAPEGKTTARLHVLWDRHVYPGHLRKILAGDQNVFVRTREGWVPGRDYARRAA